MSATRAARKVPNTRGHERDPADKTGTGVDGSLKCALGAQAGALTACHFAFRVSLWVTALERGTMAKRKARKPIPLVSGYHDWPGCLRWYG